MNIRAIIIFFAAIAASAAAQTVVEYDASFITNASTGQFAPYMIGSWNQGRIWAGNGTWLDARAEKHLDLGKRFSWGAGVEFLTGFGSKATYERFYGDTQSWGTATNQQSNIHLQQLYGELKYRGCYLLVGSKNRPSLIVDDRLSSGDVTRSMNARPIPCVSAGFVDFQDIPFTNGWVQIEGELTYGKFFDNKTRDNCFNHYQGLLTQDIMFSYKRCHFRTKPSQPFSVIAGCQNAGQFAGSTVFYMQGKVVSEDYRGFKPLQLWNMFFPEHNNGEGNAIGNSLGSWDFQALLRLKNGSNIKAYFEWFWEDGSGLAKRNGADGLWGLQYDFAKRGPVNKIVVEYIDFTNQAGPNHWAPQDSPGTNLTTMVGGADNYFNNDRYGPYANYGMAIGTPFVVSPIYNTDGYFAFAHCRARGCHVACEGNILPNLDYIFRFSAQKGWGEGRNPVAVGLEDYSAGVVLHWVPAPEKIKELNITANIAFDAGRLRGNNFGTMLTLSYCGNLSFGK